MGVSSCLSKGGLSKEREGQVVAGGEAEGGAAAEEEERTPDDPDLSEYSKIYWHDGDRKIGSKTILNANIATVMYLRGEEVHNFLSKGNRLEQVFCLVASFKAQGTQDTLRLRAIPRADLDNGTQENILRIDMPEDGINVGTCAGEVLHILSSPNLASPTVNGVYAPAFLCPSCKGIVTATNVSIYQSVEGGISVARRIIKEDFDLSSLSLGIDNESNRRDITASCTDSLCVNKGFDCCLDGECVSDGEVKSNVSHYPEFGEALLDVENNPANFIHWPNIYFVCPQNIVRTSTEEEETIDPNVAADALLAENIKEYLCLEEGKKENPDFEGLSVCEPGFDMDSFIAVRNRVWDKCGCEADPFPTSPDNPVCPDFGLKARRDQAGNILEVSCDVPALPEDLSSPFQILSLGVPARSAPHRFYRQDNGAAVDDLFSYDEQVPAEGIPFRYFDDSAKSTPENGAFNINSLTGQFSVTLNHALPAKVVNLNYNQSYLIATLEGSYTPCPQCSSDSWFEAFFAHPSSTQGIGLNSISYNTNRSDIGNIGTTHGNYEDTIFGRACWLPPTMIPFSHKKKNSVVEQRMARLQTQAAFYVNGHQRDWFGFNKGALIGSFDGVTWFAIGKARQVISTSNKLFLAINQPFADLAESGEISVQILNASDNDDSNAAQWDYDPDLPHDHLKQSTGASCQYWHQCETDTDCITNLGWEYKCSNISVFRTRWPKFSSVAEEVAGQEYERAKFGKMLKRIALDGSNAKRCHYRGMGALCKKDFTTLHPRLQKLFACAPNFYCDDLDSRNYNDQVVRGLDQLNKFLFGREANVLGRPLHYLEGAKEYLTDTIKENIRYNMEIFSDPSDSGEINDYGICRPGKALSTPGSTLSYLEQHSKGDPGSNSRTDFINQISSCDSAFNNVGDFRTTTCPAIETREGQTTIVGDVILDLNDTLSRRQNICGRPSFTTDSSGAWVSSFRSIELDPLGSLSGIFEPKLVADACFRRVGSVCHTDLDCAPNRLHADSTDFLDRESFGGTDAELMFWQEYLICGQKKLPPRNIDGNYFKYKMNKNRCCRPIGREFTMFTRDEDGIVDDPSTVNTDLGVVRFPQDDPRATGRYSRYEAINARDGSPATDPDAVYPQAPIVEADSIPKAFQWKSFQETGQKTCCGGGWIRQFASGDYNWISNVNRLQLPEDLEDFSCLNYGNTLHQEHPEFFSEEHYFRERRFFCLSPADSGCIEQEIPEADDYELLAPSDFDAADEVATLSTRPVNSPFSGGVGGINLSLEVPYEPIAYHNTVALDPSGDFTYIRNTTANGVSFYLPVYIGYVEGNDDANSGAINNLIEVTIHYMEEDSALDDDTDDEYVGDSVPSFNSSCSITQNPALDLSDNEWCVVRDGDLLVFHAKGQGSAWDYAYVDIEFNVQGRGQYLFHQGVGNPPATDALREGMKPGNDLYYLTKLGRFELLGIPQIFYEPIYCNSDRSRLVPNIFDLPGGSNSRTDFESEAFVSNNNAVNGRALEDIYGTGIAGGDVANPGRMVVLQDKVALEPVFASNNFRCCAKANEVVSDPAQCCSGFAIPSGDSNRVCKIPPRVNLNVYFNKFVSGEGVGDDLPQGGLVDEDFIPETGEPKLSAAVVRKLRSLGARFCSSGETVWGGAFGDFFPQPNSGYYRQEGSPEDSVQHSIVDSIDDFEESGRAGSFLFLAGLKWNRHHLYCK